MSDPLEHLTTLLLGTAAGNRDAFAEFFDATYNTVDAWLDPTLLREEHDDHLLAAFLEVWTHAPSFPGASQSVTQWLAATTAPALRPTPAAEPDTAPVSPWRPFSKPRLQTRSL